jgi:hypothetical protein
MRYSLGLSLSWLVMSVVVLPLASGDGGCAVPLVSVLGPLRVWWRVLIWCLNFRSGSFEVDGVAGVGVVAVWDDTVCGACAAFAFHGWGVVLKDVEDDGYTV